MSEKKGSDYDESPKRPSDYEVVLNAKKCNDYSGYPERPSDYEIVLSSKKSTEYSGYQERSSDYEVVVPSKKRRKQITLMEKLDILKRYDYGERAVDISNALDLPSSTVRSIIRSSEKIKEFGRSATPLNAKCLFKNNRSSIMVEMEEMLSEWIDHQTQNQVPLNSKVIRETAKTIYEDLRKDHDDGSNIESFKASAGWFERFKRRASLHNVPLKEESTSNDTMAANEYNSQFSLIIEEGGYTPQQVFNVDETGLFWKRMPSRAFTSRSENAHGHKASNDRLTLLLGGNAAGDFKIKPMLVYHSATPKDLKGFSIGSLPVIWKANKKAWVTQSLFDEWFNHHFCPAVTNYCTANNLPDKALLVLDTAPCHSSTLADLKHNVKVIFLPQNTAALLQPMDQRVISCFKAYYLRITFAEAIRATEGKVSPTFKEYWRDYNIKKAIDNIAAAWNEVKPCMMNSAWRNLWPECINDFRGFEEPVEQIAKDIVKMGKEMGLDELEDDDVQDLLASHSEEVSMQDLNDIKYERSVCVEVEYEDDEVHENEETSNMLTVEHLTTAVQLIENGLAILDENDPNRERSSSVKRTVNNAIDCYRELYKEKRKATAQLSLEMLFRNQSQGTDTQPQPGPSSRE